MPTRSLQNLSLLGTPVPALDLDRGAPDAIRRTAGRVRELALTWVPPASATVLRTWQALAALGRADLAVARLVEGHVDALRILHEAGREPRPGAVYGVWASASGGTGLTGSRHGDGWLVDGTMRYCSGAWFLDRALVVVEADGKRLAEVDVRAAQEPGGTMIRDEKTWPAVGMDVTRSVDVQVEHQPVGPEDLVGDPGFYLDRPGFALGGVGVAAVWLGGAAGVLDALVRGLAGSDRVNAHQRAHLGAMASAVVGADAVLTEIADRVAREDAISFVDATTVRCVVEAAVQTVLTRAVRVTGPTPLCRDAAFAHRVADLEVYVRQHHAEADLEQVGRHILAGAPGDVEHAVLTRSFG